MENHYFTNNSKLSDKLNIIEENINGVIYRFYTDSGVFSKSNLDFGSVLLIKTIIKETNLLGKFLDLGCGYGPIGIVVNKNYPKLETHQTDVNEKAVLLSEKNNILNKTTTKSYVSDGFSNINEKFDYVSLNPPIRTGKDVVYKLYEEVYNNLNSNGVFWIVIRKRQGALSHLEFLKNLFKKTEIINKSKGYYVIKMRKP